MPHAAARLGPCSDVLGFDTPMSMDHDWGLKLALFLNDDDEGKEGAVHSLLAQELPFEFMGIPTSFTPPDEKGAAAMHLAAVRPLNHAVKVTTPRQFFSFWLRLKIDQPFTVVDWLSVSAQTLRELTAGAVYHDSPGQLTAIRQELSWYPHDVWLYLLACGWQRIGQEEHLMPRAGSVGDELGSALIGSRLGRDIMSLCFLLEKQYPPYPKWFGSAFQRLACAPALTPVLLQAQRAETWQARQAALCDALRELARLHNALGVTEPLSEAVQSFFERPFMVIGGERFVEALLAQIADPAVQAVARLGLIGSVDQFSDSTDLRSHMNWRSRLQRFLDPAQNPED
jgi:hypothetical protein